LLLLRHDIDSPPWLRLEPQHTLLGADRALDRTSGRVVAPARAQAPQRVVLCGIDVGVGVLTPRSRITRPSTTPSSRYSTWYKSASQYSSSERSRQPISHQLRRMSTLRTVHQVRKLRLAGISSDSSYPQEHRSGANCSIYDCLSSFSGVTSINVARSRIHSASVIGRSAIMYRPVGLCS
jgi:hypothetical protein